MHQQTPEKSTRRNALSSLFRGGLSGCLLALVLAGDSIPGASNAIAGEVCPGLTYKNERVASVPWSIHVLQIDRSRQDFKFRPTLGQHEMLGLSTLSEQVRNLPPGLGRPLAAINGDFFHLENEPYAGDPMGVLVLDSELVSAPDGKGCFWLDA